MGDPFTAIADFGKGVVNWLAKALGFYQPPPPKVRYEPPTPEKPAAPEKKTKPVLGATQKKRADARLAALAPEDRKKFDAVVKDAGSDTEREYLQKGLACNYPVAEIEAFAKKIKGKDAKWMQDNLAMTGSSSGKGIKQQWSHSCNATTVQAIRGELDPMYALKLHEENADITDADDTDGAKKNAKLAAEQKAMLESNYGGVATGSKGTAANREKEAAKAGRGRWADDLMTNMKDVTGLTYSQKKLDDSYKVSDALTAIDKALAKGQPVPIVIGNGPNKFTHYVLVTFMDEGPPKEYTVHDPYDGVTVTRSAEDMSAGKINLAGSNQITALDLPAES